VYKKETDPDRPLSPRLRRGSTKLGQFQERVAELDAGNGGLRRQRLHTEKRSNGVFGLGTPFSPFFRVIPFPPDPSVRRYGILKSAVAAEERSASAGEVGPETGIPGAPLSQRGLQS